MFYVYLKQKAITLLCVKIKQIFLETLLSKNGGMYYFHPNLTVSYN